jgi:hypothetical protein
MVFSWGIAQGQCPWAVAPGWNSGVNDQEFTMSVALADLDNDNDNDLDMVVGNYKYPYYFNQYTPQYWGETNEESEFGAFLVAYERQSGVFLSPVNLTTIRRCIDCIAIADYDQDGDQDIAMGLIVGKGKDGGVVVLKNKKELYPGQQTSLSVYFEDNPAGLFYWSPTQGGVPVSFDCHCVRWVDFDCDGDLDLATLEVGGILRIYVNGDDHELALLPIIDDFSPSEPLNQPNIYDDLVDPVDYDIPGLTMEFGDMDMDGDLDVFINSSIDASGINAEPSPHVYKNMYVPEIQIENIYDANESWVYNPSPTEEYAENSFCASFGFYNGTTSRLALAVGSYDFHSRSTNNGVCANDIYTLVGQPGNEILEHAWHAAHNESTPANCPQLVTDIQWAYLDDDQDYMDLVAVSYPTLKKDENGDLVPDRGKEQIHLNPQEDASLPSNEQTNNLTNWTITPDRSTSLALGDIDPNPAAIVVDTVRLHKNDPRRLVYVPRFPFQKVVSVAFTLSGEPIQSNTVPIWACDTQNGWVSIARDVNPPPEIQWDSLEVIYTYSTELDLAVGNDGMNCVYYHGELSGISAPMDNQAPWIELPQIFTYNENWYGIDPEDDDLDLIADDAFGGTETEQRLTGLNRMDVEDYLADRPEIRRLGFMPYWNHTEIFQGHYFWNWWDKKLEAARQNGAKSHLCSWNTPNWTKGNWSPLADDPKNRTSDEHLHTRWVRNLVNRYRPGGICAQNWSYNWNADDWGVTIYQFENEPNNDTYGYAWDVNGLKAIAEKMYLQYQMIKFISFNSYQSDPSRLEVATPNFCQDTYGLISERHFWCPPVPYLNDLNAVILDQYTGDPTHVLWNYCDLICLQSYCTRDTDAIAPPEYENWFLAYQDPLAWKPLTTTPGETRFLGMEQMFWGLYTPGLEEYFSNPPNENWDPVMAGGPEHPFFIMEWFYSHYSNVDGNNYDQKRAWTACQAAEMASIDVFPQDPARNHRLLRYNVPWSATWQPAGNNSGFADVFNTVAKELNGKKFKEYYYEPFSGSEPDPTDLVRLSFWNPGGPMQGDEEYVDLLRTYTASKPNPTPFALIGDNVTPIGSRIPVYQVEGGYVDRGVYLDTDLRYIDFAPNELRPDRVSVVDETDILGGAGAYSQALQLERGWNLVSWYVWPEDPGQPPLTMDDLFDQEPQPPGGPDDWFWSEPANNPTDKVGRFDLSPYEPSAYFYPEYGKDNMSPPWLWNLRQAYPIYMDSPAHFWEFTNQPLYNPPTPPPNDPDDDFTPNAAWDDYTQAGVPHTEATTYWFFISYPKRSELKISDSQTIRWLADYTQNQLRYIKDDDGHCYNVADPNHATLEYLRPGHGYFLGYRYGGNVNYQITDCPWFFDETADPQSIEPKPGENQQIINSVSNMHFQFKSRTHWWYPIEIDTISVEGQSPVQGDEIAVYDGNLCVGAQTFTGQYPICLAAWKDDISTPDTLDGYMLEHEITFKWFDASANQEITFVPPPGTQSLEPEIDPYFPTHSGFGKGFSAVRSLVNGTLSVSQLPVEFKLIQNYPNPFNSETIIPLELPQRSNVKIELFNIRGQSLGIIYQGIQNAGWPNISYNASSLASGIYFYQVTALGLEHGGKYQNTGKMLLLK